MRVATRPNPQINIGAVDMSCAFVVCDARKYDMPIVYCSATFERLTGYTKHEILGRNCRFLQSPMGDVEPGVKRKYVDDDAVRYLKIQCDARKESQTSLINYRKGGQPFMNLLTTIPIQWDSAEIAYFVGMAALPIYMLSNQYILHHENEGSVKLIHSAFLPLFFLLSFFSFCSLKNKGFQVDLVDQPGSIMNKNQGISSCKPTPLWFSSIRSILSGVGYRLLITMRNFRRLHCDKLPASTASHVLRCTSDRIPLTGPGNHYL